MAYANNITYSLSCFRHMSIISFGIPLSHYIGSRCRYPDKAKTLPKIGRVLPCVDKKDAFKALKVKNLLFFKLSNVIMLSLLMGTKRSLIIPIGSITATFIVQKIYSIILICRIYMYFSGYTFENYILSRILCYGIVSLVVI